MALPILPTVSRAIDRNGLSEGPRPFNDASQTTGWGASFVHYNPPA
jgi:hypothetical protein